MAICEACGGSGHILTGSKPLTFHTCPLCGGLRTDLNTWCKFGVDNFAIQMHNPHQKDNISGQETRFMLDSFDEGALMAHVMKEAGLFKSVSQARKNGWDKPIQKGTFTVGKNKKQIVVE